MIYLDHNATTPLRPEVLEAMMPYLQSEYGNASSLYQLGQHSRKAVEEARSQLAEFIGASSPDEIVFTSGGTESNNMALKGAVYEHKNKGRRVVSSAIEHSSVRNVVQHLCDIGHIDNVVAPVGPDGILEPHAMEEAMTPDTVLVTLMGANNEIGTLQPVSEVSAVCRKKNILFHCDAVQMAGKAPIRVHELGVDLLSLSAHKFGGPKGIGVLYIRKGTRLRGLIQGGRQEKNRRGGTENVANIVGMGTAAKYALKEQSEESQRLKRLRDSFENQILTEISVVSINGNKEKRTCNTTNICFEFTDSSEMIMALDLKGIACSSGSACAAGSADPSHVLLAMGLPQEKAHASLRFSLGHNTTESELSLAIPKIKETVARLRDSNPLWKEKIRN